WWLTQIERARIVLVPAMATIGHENDRRPEIGAPADGDLVLRQGALLCLRMFDELAREQRRNRDHWSRGG
ncbi:MAG: hypothetical protein D6721_02430, partial [Gammaproteobacteria bacterium]